jgi:hypothetical protein
VTCKDIRSVDLACRMASVHSFLSSGEPTPMTLQRLVSGGRKINAH